MRKGQPAWQKWARNRLPESVLRKAHIPLDSSKPLTKDQTYRLRLKYRDHQYKRLRAGGVNVEEAKALRAEAPPAIARVLRDRRTWAQEMVSKYRGVTTAGAFKREVRLMLDTLAKKQYTASQWATFAAWYSKRSRHFPFPQEPAPSRKPVQQRPRIASEAPEAPLFPKQTKKAPDHGLSQKALARIAAASKKAYQEALKQERLKASFKPDWDIPVVGKHAKAQTKARKAAPARSVKLYRDKAGRFTTTRTARPVKIQITRDKKGRFSYA